MYQSPEYLLLSHRLSVSREVPMFDHNCTVCSTRQLIFPGLITSMTNTDRGIVVAFTCWCGAEQTMTTGRATEPRRKVTLAA